MYPNGGLGVLQTITVPPPTYDTEESSEDSDSDGANPPFLSTSPSCPFELGNFEPERGQEMAYHGLMKNVAVHASMAELHEHGTFVIQRALDFEAPRTSPANPMDITQDAPNRSGAPPNTTIGGDTEQATAQNPPRPPTRIREVGTEAIRLVQHLTGMVERK